MRVWIEEDIGTYGSIFERTGTTNERLEKAKWPHDIFTKIFNDYKNATVYFTCTRSTLIANNYMYQWKPLNVAAAWRDQMYLERTEWHISYSHCHLTWRARRLTLLLLIYDVPVGQCDTIINRFFKWKSKCNRIPVRWLFATPYFFFNYQFNLRA